MHTFELTCTEPGRWDRAPDAEAPASEILAYLQHCDECDYHTRLAREEDRSLDLLLRDACGDLIVDDVALPGAAGARRPRSRWRRTDRGPVARYGHEGLSFERRLTQACILAFGIVVLWIAFSSYQRDPAGSAEAVVAEAETPETAVPAPGPVLATIGAEEVSRLYFTRVVSAEYDRQFMQSSRERLVAEIPDYDVGSVLLVTNPFTGASVEVEILRRSYRDHEILLSTSAADVLGLDSAAVVFVQALSNPSSARPNLAP
jgi:hypothetical protein